MTIEDYIGTAVLHLRRTAGVSQSGLTARTGLSRPYISKVENGGVTPSLTSLERVATGLNLQVSDLVLCAEQIMREEP